MNFIRNLSIRNKLLLVSLIPLLTLLYFLTDSISNEIESRNNLQKVYNDVLEIEAIAKVKHQILQERGHSIAYLASSGVEEKSELFSQRVETDRAIFDLRQTLKNQEKSKLFPILDNMPEIRNAVNSLSADPDSVATVYTEMKTLLIDDVNKTYGRAEDTEIRSLLETHVFLLYSKGFLGQIRMWVHLAALSGSFQDNEFAEFASLKGKFEANLERFRKSASPELLNEYNRKMANPAIRITQALIDSVFNRSDAQIGFSADHWRVNITSFLEAHKELEDLSAVVIRQTAEDRLSAISGTLAKNMIITLLIILLIGLLLYYLIRYMVSSIMEIKQAADRIAEGDLDLSLSIKSRDEIGSLAGSFNRLIQVSREYAQAADVIGRGDYSPVVQVRGEEDILGASLNNMKINLQKLSQENKTRDWLLTGNSELNDLMRGEQEIRELAQAVVSKLTEYMNAQVGAIYLAENGQLKLTGSYAYKHRKDNNNILKYGEGLVGQAALEKKPIIFSEIPDDYVRINSGLGSARPKNIIVYPFLFDGQVKGVIEIGTAYEFSDNDMD
ncbi:MAG: nitrate- and nitrite sensing domain-containing protein, partial [Bacteroidetes bacterium]|nr:nitrate- and nitrite sensing domain-containing protein [Bacteroidota bacterium]